MYEPEDLDDYEYILDVFEEWMYPEEEEYEYESTER